MFYLCIEATVSELGQTRHG